ncbi:zinc finger protein constans-like [Anaeramoeba flamelloides]|uniref:Zinc finger protein constans-like n=1 Tax=Anaeramoeba flamelloides TaxID=1746091 RepID=A0AAV7Y9Q1_9EUKA|nr:zinc finger protein constans-like [Anaeramoeba flamelloides]
MNNPKNHKLKQKTNTNNPKNQKKPKSKLKMNKQKRQDPKRSKEIQDPQRLKDIRIPVEPLIPECEVCERQKAHFYCTVCKVHYCQNCESQVHTSFLKKKHKEFTFQEPYDPQEKKQINMKLVKKNYQKLNELTQYQFKKMNEEISIEQNEKYMKLNKQSMKMQKGIDEFNESEMIIKEIEICKKYNDYQQILLNFSKLKKLLPILNKNKKNKLICNSKFNKINIISNELKQNLKNWKLNLPF